jgi:hypothetical protein
MRKFFALAGVSAVAIGAPLLAASSASADQQPLISLGEGACVAPWWWEGPGNIGNDAQKFRACDDTHVSDDQTGSLVAALDGSCLLPWHWEGPLDLFEGVAGDPAAMSVYDVCNDTHVGGHDDRDHGMDQGQG